MKTKMIGVVSAFNEPKNIEDIIFSLSLNISTEMDHRFITIKDLTSLVSEAIKHNFDTSSILNGGPAENYQIISKKKMRDRITGSRDLDPFEMILIFFPTKHSRKKGA